MNKQITVSEILAMPKKDTTGWERTRAFITMCYNPVEVTDNGTIVGYLLDMTVKYDGALNTATMRNVEFVMERYYIPKSHLDSFGRYTGLIIWYNPKKLSETVVPDPNQKPWHYEV